jgi:preprotein translocase subunit SecD
VPPNTATLRVGPYFLSLLLVLVVSFGLVFLPGQRHTPKLGLDLEGGAQVTLQAQTPNGKTPNQSAMKVAREILEKRVNAKGVSAAQVYQQSTNQIVIAVPGANSEDVAKVGQAAKLNFRPVVFAAVANSTTAVTPSATTPSASAGASAGSSGKATTGAATTAPKTTGAATTAAKTTGAATTAPASAASPSGLLDANRFAPSTTPATGAAKTSAAATSAAKTSAAATTPSAAATTTSADPFKGLGFTLPTSDTAYNALTTAQQSALSAALGKFNCASKPTDVATKPLASCDNNTPPQYKYFLGPVVVAGTEVSSADAVAPSASGNTTWTVSINLKSKGQAAWAKFTNDHHSDATTNPGGATSCAAATVPCADYVAFTLDGDVITAPQTNSTINGTTQVSGTFTESYAKDLANDLKYGSLPLNFTQLTQQQVSPTLGTSQLKAGLLAGGIGLLLVVIYSFLYYRGLGFVTVASLLVSGGLTYAALVILGREIGFTLTLAGIAGFIVAVGITADSFVVLFERLKDEVHSGRSLRVAVPRAWTRARRTILSADTVSFIAAAVLYYFTVGDVRGFAFTLGLSTLLDLVVVFLFTHPLVSLLSRSRAFGSPRFTGLNSVRAGGIAPSPEGPARAAKTRRTKAAGGATVAGGSVALLEREDDDLDLDDSGFYSNDEDDPVVIATAPAATREPELDSGAPRRSRVVPRSTPPAEIGADAAERAAARRGRAVRPPKPVIEQTEELAEADDDVEDEIDDDAVDDDVVETDAVENDAVETDAVENDAVENDAVETVAVDTDRVASVEAETGGSTAVDADTEVAPVAKPMAAAPRGASTAAERAAARRRQPGRRGQNAAPAEPEPMNAPVEAVETAPVEAAEVVPTQAETAEAAPAETTVEPQDEAPAEAGTGAALPMEATAAGDVGSARKATAVERAAARRARIRSRAGHPVDTDDEDGS